MKLVSVLVFLICRESRYQNSILDTSLLPDNAAQTADAEDDTELLEAMYIYWLEVNKSADNESNAFDSSDDDRDAFDAMFCSWIEGKEELRYQTDSDEGDASAYSASSESFAYSDTNVRNDFASGAKLDAFYTRSDDDVSIDLSVESC